MSTFHDPPASSSSAKTTSPSSTLHADFASQALSLELLAQSSSMADCEADQATPEPSAKILAQVSSTVGARLSTGDSQELAPTDSSLPKVADALLLLGSGASQTSTESIASGERERRPAASAASAEKASLAKVTSSTKTKRLDRKYRLAKCPICTDQNLAFPTHLTKQDPIACSLCGRDVHSRNAGHERDGSQPKRAVQRRSGKDLHPYPGHHQWRLHKFAVHGAVQLHAVSWGHHLRMQASLAVVVSLSSGLRGHVAGEHASAPRPASHDKA